MLDEPTGTARKIWAGRDGKRRVCRRKKYRAGKREDTRESESVVKLNNREQPTKTE